MKNKILHLISFAIYFGVVALFLSLKLIESEIVISKYVPVLILCIVVLFFKKHVFVDAMLIFTVLSGSVGCMLYSMGNGKLIPWISLIEMFVLIIGFVGAIILQMLYTKKYSNN